MAGLLLLGYPTSVFNGGRSQVGFNFPNGNVGEYPFLNLMKSSGTWQFVSGSGAPDPSTFDAQGYPTSLPGGGVFATVFMPPLATRGGNYVITWSGVGTVYVNGTQVALNGTSKTNTVSPGRYEFTSSDASLGIGISSFTSQITDIKVFHSDDEAALLAGGVFGIKFVERLREAKFAVLRFMNWQISNGDCNITTWAMRKPSDYVTWAGQELRSDIWAGSTTNSGDDYSITFGSGAPVDKTLISLKFNASKTFSKVSVTFDSTTDRVTWPAHGLSINDPIGFGVNSGVLPTVISNAQNFYVKSVVDANTITISRTASGATLDITNNGSGDVFGNRQPTLNLNGTGAVPIKFISGITMGTTGSPLANLVGTVMYDADMGSWLLSGGGTNTGSRWLQNGVPYEICVQLSTLVGAHPWFVIPYYTATPLTDFYASLATYIKDSGPSWMIPRFEGCNELWNSITNPTNYAVAKATAWGWGADLHNWMGKSMALLGQAISGVYSGNTARYQVVCGVQTASFTSLPLTSQNPRLTSALFVAEGGFAASTYVTHVACAQYMSPSAYNSATEAALVTQWDNGADPTALDDYVDTLNSGSGFVNLTNLNTLYQNIRTWATGLGVNGLCGYEGGYSPDFRGDGRDTFRAASKQAPALQTYTTTNYDNFINAGGEFPSCFQLAGSVPSSNIWSVLEDIYVTPDPPQWLAIKAFNA